MSKDTPLLPLEYCRIDRAARLLKCEVLDLLHWGATNRVELNLRLERESVISSPLLDEETIAEMIVAFVVGTSPTYEAKDRTIKQTKISFDEFTAVDEMQVLDLVSPWLEARAIGLWALASSTLCLFEQEKTAQIINAGVALSRRTQNGELMVVLAAREDWTPDVNELFIRKECLHRLSEHIASGKPLPKLQDGIITSELAQAMPKARSTAKQSLVIAELLTAHGVKDEDFQGSIEALKQKIASKGLSKTLVNVDKNTLSDWLRKAGVRQ